VGLVPPSAAECLHQRRRVCITACRRRCLIQCRLQLLALRIEQTKVTDASSLVALRRNIIGCLSFTGSLGPRPQRLSVVLNCIESIRDFLEGLKHSLAVKAVRFAVSCLSLASFRLQAPPLKMGCVSDAPMSQISPPVLKFVPRPPPLPDSRICG
jgi:hypothetical protein